MESGGIKISGVNASPGEKYVNMSSKGGALQNGVCRSFGMALLGAFLGKSN